MHNKEKKFDPVLNRALNYGYKLGAEIQGGAFCFTQACLTKMHQLGYLHFWDPDYTGICWTEAHFFTMLAYAP